MRKTKTVKAFKTPYTPTPEQLEKACKRIRQFLAFAEDYLHRTLQRTGGINRAN